MANISPFKATYYNSQKVRLEDVITPPYDVIPAQEVPRYRDRSPHNFAHIDLPHAAEDDYSHAAELLQKWTEQGILVEDTAPAFYLYQQTFQAGSSRHTRSTLMAAVQLMDFSEGIIRPHENTFGKYKEDRLRQMARTRFNLSHIFGMVRDKEGFLATVFESVIYRTPLLVAKAEDSVEHAVWRLGPEKTEALRAFFVDKPIYIVDGHHRYESALRHAKETGAYGDAGHPAASTLFAIANAYDPAMVVLPTHRVLRGIEHERFALEHIEQAFDLLRVSFNDLKRFCLQPPVSPSFGLYFQENLYVCSPKHWQSEESTWGKSIASLSVAWSDRKFMSEFAGIDDNNRREKVTYWKDIVEAWEQRTSADAIVFHAPAAIEQVLAVADEQHFMPQKSTYFYPKIAAGLVMRSL